MKGHIRQRGKNSFELKFDAGRDPATGKRKIQYARFKGTKREAQIKLAALIASVGAGSYVEPSQGPLWPNLCGPRRPMGSRGRHLRPNGAALSAISRKSDRAAPWREGATEAYAASTSRDGTTPCTRAAGGPHDRSRAPRTGQGTARRRKRRLVVRNVCKLQKAPKVAESEMAIVQDVPGLVAKLRGSRLCVPAMMALFTGMRLGEVLALRWSRIDLDGKVIQVREALEPTKARHPVQGAKVQGRPPRHHVARFPGRDVAGAS